MITKAEFLNGLDKYHRKVSPATSGQMILDTVPATVDGALWYEVNNNVPTLKLHAGNYNYGFKHDSITYTGGNSHLVAYLPFDVSTTADACGNEWTASGSPTIADGACSFNGSSYLVLNEAISLGGRNFTADAWFKSTANQNWRTALYIGNLSATNSYNLLCLTQTGNTLYFSTAYGQNFALINDFQNNVRRHIAFVYSHAEEAVKVFLDGELKQTVSMAISRTAVQLVLGSGFLATDVAHFTGTLDHVRVFDGVALWTSNFTPPTANDYA